MDEFIGHFKRLYGEYHSNRNEIFNDLNLFYVLSFLFVGNNNNIVRCIWHKDWDEVIISYSFHKDDYLAGKPTVWSMPQKYSINKLKEVFAALSDEIFLNTSIYKTEVFSGELNDFN